MRMAARFSLLVTLLWHHQAHGFVQCSSSSRAITGSSCVFLGPPDGVDDWMLSTNGRGQEYDTHASPPLPEHRREGLRKGFGIPPPRASQAQYRPPPGMYNPQKQQQQQQEPQLPLREKQELAFSAGSQRYLARANVAQWKAQIEKEEEFKYGPGPRQPNNRPLSKDDFEAKYGQTTYYGEGTAQQTPQPQLHRPPPPQQQQQQTQQSAFARYERANVRQWKAQIAEEEAFKYGAGMTQAYQNRPLDQDDFQAKYGQTSYYGQGKAPRQQERPSQQQDPRVARANLHGWRAQQQRQDDFIHGAYGNGGPNRYGHDIYGHGGQGDFIDNLYVNDDYNQPWRE